MAGQSLLELLVEDLQSENRMVRCETLRQLAEIPFDEPVAGLIRPLISDQDPEIQFLARHALQSFHGRQTRTDCRLPEFQNISDLQQKLLSLPLPEFQILAVRCPKPSSGSMMDAFRGGLLAKETRLEFQVAMIRAFRRFGTALDQELIEPFLTSEPLLAIEAIGALEKISPDSLCAKIPPILDGTADRSLQMRALRALLRLDQNQGLAFLRQQFISTDPVIRANAVMHCLALPFKTVRDPLFHMLALEEDSRILARAAYVLFMNPEEKTVFWLMDILMGAKPVKAKWCQTTMECVLEAIKVSGIMEDSAAAFIQHVRQMVQRRQLNTRIGALVAELDEIDPMRRYEAIEGLRHYESEPEVRKKFQDLFLSEKDAKVKGLLTAIFAQNPDRARLQLEMNPVKFARLGHDGQMALLGQVKSVEEFSFVRDHLRVLAKQKLEGIVQAEVIRLMALYGDEKAELPSLMMALRSPEGVVVARAIEGIHRLAPANLHKEFPKLIRSPIPAIRASALRAFYQEDKTQAIAVLQEMLLSESSMAKEQALVCLAQLNYSSTRPLLLRFLGEDGNLALVKKAGVILKSNPDADAIWVIQEMIIVTRGPKKAVLEDVLRDCAEIAIEVGLVVGPVDEYLKKLKAEQ